jgi:uncharacterized membrane protein YtjA (UPF0391 family)
MSSPFEKGRRRRHESLPGSFHAHRAGADWRAIITNAVPFFPVRRVRRMADSPCGAPGMSIADAPGTLNLNDWRCAVLYYAAVFLVIALVAALLGFGGLAAGAASIAQILFYIFLVIALVSLIAGLMRR